MSVLFFQRTQNQFPGPKTSSSQQFVTAAWAGLGENLKPFSVFLRHLQSWAQTHTYTQNLKNIYVYVFKYSLNVEHGTAHL